VLAKWREEIVASGPAIAALSSSQLVATGVTTSPAPATSSGDARPSVVIEVGRLYLLKLRVPKTGRPEIPALEQEFNCAMQSDEYTGRLLYLGVIRCN